MKTDTGILLTNIGTPDAPTPRAVCRYLREFLSDRRVVELPRILWYPILFGIILPLRSFSSAKLYRAIWQNGSPLLTHTQHIARKLSESLSLPVAVGMNYGNPSIEEALSHLQEKNIQNILILPLYPQYSATSTASALDRVAAVLQHTRNLPAVRTIKDYADHPDYIDAICRQINGVFARSGKKFLIFSYHGIPRHYADLGDPYPERCRLSTAKITQQLGLKSHEFCMTFQSRLGYAEWLSPYTGNTLKTLPSRGITEVQVICPGFAVDCLETLEEIAIRGRDQFMSNGGQYFEYIPALNDSAGQMTLLTHLADNKF